MTATPSATPAAATPPAVSVRGLAKSYGATRVLDLDRLDLAAGQIHVLVGPNGAGKTSLLRSIAGLEFPDAGELRVLGSGWKSSPGGRLELRRRIGLATQKPYLFATTVRRNVEYPLRSRGMSGSESAARAEAAMRRLGMIHLAERRARTLSAGETQRTAIARAVVSEPQLLLLDEPLANIDPESTHLVEDLCRELAAGGVTVVVATHALSLAYHLSARVVRLEHGRLMPSSVENLLSGEILLIDGEEDPVLVTSEGLRLAVATDKRGPVRAAIEPRDVVVSTESFHSSARNSLRGRITGMEDRGESVRVTADVGVRLVATITHHSVGELGLTIGSEVYFTFKATALQVF